MQRTILGLGYLGYSYAASRHLMAYSTMRPCGNSRRGGFAMPGT